jgi:hypothetical protein
VSIEETLTPEVRERIDRDWAAKMAALPTGLKCPTCGAPQGRMAHPHSTAAVCDACGETWCVALQASRDADALEPHHQAARQPTDAERAVLADLRERALTAQRKAEARRAAP